MNRNTSNAQITVLVPRTFSEDEFNDATDIDVDDIYLLTAMPNLPAQSTLARMTASELESLAETFVETHSRITRYLNSGAVVPPKLHDHLRKLASATLRLADRVSNLAYARATE